MSIIVGDNFDYKAGKPLDGRLVYATLADMKAVADATMYNGCLAYCVATDKTYQWKSSNTVDPDTGKWREFSTGSSIEVDDEIDEESTNPVQNAVIAEALDTKQDAADKMTASDMDDVVTPLPSVMSRRFKYSTEEQVIGEWIDGRPLYQKTCYFKTPTVASDTFVYTLGNGIDIAFIKNGFMVAASGTTIPLLDAQDGGAVFIRTWLSLDNGVRKIKQAIRENQTNYQDCDCYCTVCYAKTTD